MKRGELKPGTIFRYSTDTRDSYVPPMDNPPKDAVRSIAAPDFCWDEEVIVISEPTTNQRPLEPPPGSCISHDEEMIKKAIAQKVTSLPHYTGHAVEAIDVIEDWGLGFRLANVIKYIARHGKKSGQSPIDDLKKARAYLSREIAALEGRRSWE